MLKHSLIYLAVLQVLFTNLVSTAVLAVPTSNEETINLDEVTQNTAVEATHPKSLSSNLSIFGRIDLTYDKTLDQNSELKNQHFLLFLKAKASHKTSFMGEFITQAFYAIDYQATEDFKFSFGKVLVPFGDNRYFHRYYGGLQGYGATGVMFKNIWAEPGIIVTWQKREWQTDIYWINGVQAPDINTDVDLKSSTSERQAVGTRVQKPLLDKLQVLASAYYADYWPGRPLYLAGLDIYTSYGALGLKNWRFSVGAANAWIEGSPTGRNFQKYGDYVQVATNLLSWAEWRLRYGTYDNDDRTEDVNDTQSLNLGATFLIDVMKLLVEYQFNYEAKNEIDNDIARAMLSLDF